MQRSALLTVVRHGETSANVGGVWHGSTDTPLSDRGVLQAERVAEHIATSYSRPVAIYSSPLERAHRTAHAIATRLELNLRTDPGLSEYDLGSWEGKTYKELHTRHRLWDFIREDPDFAPHGGESPLQVVTRYESALRRIAAAHPDERVVVVGHGGALSMTFAQILDGDYTSWNRVMHNCAVTELALEPTPRLISFNTTSHLDGI